MTLHIPIISTERLCLRKWQYPDYEPFISLNADPDVMKYFPKILNREESLAMIERIRISFETNNYGLYAVEHKISKEFLGFTGFSKPSFKISFTPCIEIGWRFKKDVWGNGYATEAASACLNYGFGELGFNQVFSFTTIGNLKSESVMKRIGMNKIGEFNHPSLDASSALRPHVLYEISKN